MLNPRNIAKTIATGASVGWASLKAPAVAGLRRVRPSLDKVSDKVADEFDMVMDFLAAKPDSPSAGHKLLRFAVEAAPGGPTVRTFAEARELYGTASPEEMEKAKRLCVKAALELVTDAAFVGLLRLKKLRYAASAVRYGRQAKKTLTNEPSSDVFDQAAEKLLKHPKIEAAAERALSIAQSGKEV